MYKTVSNLFILFFVIEKRVKYSNRLRVLIFEIDVQKDESDGEELLGTYMLGGLFFLCSKFSDILF